MKFLNKVLLAIKSGRVWLHLLISVVVFVVLVLLFFRYLDYYTHHGESITVPPMVGMTLEEAKEFLKDKDMQLQVTDSVYNPNLKAGEIINQQPNSGNKVKEGRNIYLTIRSYVPERNIVPDVESLSLRNAVSKLENAGFIVDEKIYKPFKYPNTVIHVSKDEMKVSPGSHYPKGTEFDLVVGNGLGETKVKVPDLRGMRKREAEAVLFGGYELNIGNIRYHESVESIADSNEAKVYKQIPEPGKEMRIGEFVDLHLMARDVYEQLTDTTGMAPTIDSTEIPLDSIDQQNM